MSTQIVLVNTLRQRANDQCELCKSEDDLRPFAVAPYEDDEPEHNVLMCAVCRGQVSGEVELDPKHWFGLQETIWSEVPAVQVVSYRMLDRLSGEGWARDLLDQAYLVDEVMVWAREGMEDTSETRPRVLDSNGTELSDGDSVTLIKDLDVKGAGFVAKRGTLVKGIRLTDDPEHVEGKVNGVDIVLKTMFLKRA